ncbi:HEAT repeat domain-containing protein [Amycolatopsis sp. H6(2020)]|nr:HEAT repeat domain-containing protein [Amycolatopsis sp. H6(2020)]
MVYVDIPESELSEEQIRNAVAGRISEIPSSVALSILADRDSPGIDRIAVLRDATRNQELAGHTRIGALRVYARLAHTDALPSIVEALESSETHLAAAAAETLGRTGTADNLEALQRLRTSDDEVLRTRAAFAETLIVHRFGLSDRTADLPQPETLASPDPAGALTFTSVRPGTRRGGQAVEAIERALPWFAATVHQVHEIQCGRRLLEIAVDPGLAGLRDRPAVPAVIATQNSEHGGFHPSLIALSRPAGQDEVTVSLHRLSGEAVYVGEGRMTENDIELDVRSVAAPGVAPIAVRVRGSASTLEVSGFSARRTARKRSPQRAPAPEG